MNIRFLSVVALLIPGLFALADSGEDIAVARVLPARDNPGTLSD